MSDQSTSSPENSGTFEPAHIRTLWHGALQKIYRFENGYGASVIKGGPFAYGGLELGVITFPGSDPTVFELNYDTPITDDVLGYLDEDQVPEILWLISGLPARTAAAA